MSSENESKREHTAPNEPTASDTSKSDDISDNIVMPVGVHSVVKFLENLMKGHLTDIINAPTPESRSDIAGEELKEHNLDTPTIINIIEEDKKKPIL